MYVLFRTELYLCQCFNNASFFYKNNILCNFFMASTYICYPTNYDEAKWNKKMCFCFGAHRTMYLKKLNRTLRANYSNNLAESWYKLQKWRLSFLNRSTMEDADYCWRPFQSIPGLFISRCREHSLVCNMSFNFLCIVYCFVLRNIGEKYLNS